MIVKVKKKHIQLGERKSCYHCPIALAVKDALKCHIVDVTTLGISVQMTKDDDYIQYRATNKVKNFVLNYDDFENPKPMQFRLIRKKKNAFS